MSATILHRPPLKVIDDAHYVGGDDTGPNTYDLVAMRCRPKDPDQLQAVAATWPNVFKAAAADLAGLMGCIPADCSTPDLYPSYPVDQRVYSKSQSFSDQQNSMVSLSLQPAMDTGATIFQYAGTPFNADTGRTTGWGVLSPICTD